MPTIIDLLKFGRHGVPNTERVQAGGGFILPPIPGPAGGKSKPDPSIRLGVTNLPPRNRGQRAPTSVPLGMHTDRGVKEPGHVKPAIGKSHG